jgi:nucleoid-associated protein YgaU
MWTIAAGRVDGDPSGYWLRLVDLNRDRFEDVDLIHPGDTVLLPPLN